MNTKFYNRAMSRSTIVDECWVFDGHTSSSHGNLTLDGKTQAISRWALNFTQGEREGMWALHKCKTKGCWNPEHLYWGTASDNLKDEVKDGTHYNATKNHCSKGHKFDESNTYLRPTGGRQCKECRRTASRLSQRARRARNKLLLGEEK